MNEAVEIDLRNIIQRNTTPVESREEDHVDITGMTLSEVMDIERNRLFPEEIRAFDEKHYDKLVGELYMYMKYGKK